jgi:dihydrofolate reductase
VRRLVLSIGVTLDGFVGRPDGGLDWHLADEELESEALALLCRADAILLGRRTYELFAGYWPAAAAANAGSARVNELAGLIDTMPKIVFSRTLEAPPWGPTRVIGDDVPGAIAELKRQPGGDLVLFGGQSVAALMSNLDLVDEYRLLVHPILLGDGVPLARGLKEHRLRRTEVRTFESGVVVLRYQRA